MLDVKAAITQGLHHFVYTYNAAAWNGSKIYIDGVKVFENPMPGTIGNIGPCSSWGFVHLQIGNNWEDNTNQYWRGWLDDWAMYTTAKDATWVTTYADATPPDFENVSPASGAVGVLLDAPVVFEVTDTESGVDTASVVVTVNGVVAWTGGAAAGGWIGVVETIADGYRYTLTPPADWDRDALISVDVLAEDLAENSATSAWTFHTGGMPGNLQAIEDTFADMMHSRWLSSARGLLLDMVGAIVGARRETPLVLTEYVPKQEIPAGQPTYNADVGASARDLLPSQHAAQTNHRAFITSLVTSVINASSSNLGAADDEQYRREIRLQIAFNTSHGQPETLISIAKQITCASQVRFLRKAPATVVLFCHRIVWWAKAGNIEGAAAGGTCVVVTGEQTATPFAFSADKDTSGVACGPASDIGAGFNEVGDSTGGHISEVYSQ